MRYIDPSGHKACGIDTKGCKGSALYGLTMGDKAEMSLSYVKNVGGSTSRSNLKRSGVFFAPLSKLWKSGYVYSSDHRAIDYGDPPTVITASGNGIVVVADNCSLDNCFETGTTGYNVNSGYGNVVVVEYPYGTLPSNVIEAVEMEEGQSLYMMYAHLQGPITVKVGQTVTPGERIGLIGSTGNSKGSHLHFVVAVGDTGTVGFGPLCTDLGGCGEPAQGGNFRDLTAKDPDLIPYSSHLYNNGTRSIDQPWQTLLSWLFRRISNEYQ